MRKYLLLLWSLLATAGIASAQALFNVLSPSAGATTTGCQTLKVKYEKLPGATDQQRIEISFNNGRTYFDVAQKTSGTAIVDSVDIAVPNRPTQTARIRVRDLSGGTATAGVSAGTFAILPSASVPPFFVTAPVGVQTFPVASTQRITWSGPADRSYTLSYSFSTTSGFQDIATVSGRNFYDWNIPAQSSRLYLRVTDAAEPCRVAFSDTLFRSSATVPGIGLTNFNGGEVVDAGSPFVIRWSTNGISADSLVLSFSADNGANWQVLSDSIPRTGSYAWTVPPISTTQALFRIAVRGNPALNDVSNSPFSIRTSTITLASQTIAGPLTGCQDLTVNWSAVATSGFYKIIVSPNAGQTWYPASGTLAFGATGSFSKTIKVPSLNSSTCLLAVIDPFVNSNRDTTNSFFTVSSATPLLSLTFPTGGQTLAPGTNATITWTTAGTVPNVDVLYTPDAGQNWLPIATNVSNTGSRVWAIPAGLSGASFLVRVQASGDTCLASQSNPLTLSNNVNAGVVDVLFPNGGEVLTAGQTQTIRWQAANLSAGNQVSIELSTDGGSTYGPVATVANTGSYDWTVPNQATSTARVRIADAGNGAVKDSSAGTFQILANQPPTASAGPNLTIRLPANSVTIIGTGADPEGQALTFSWQVASGPTQPNLTNANLRIVTAFPLVQGTYVFRLTVTDPFGAFATSDVRVSVLPDTGTPRTAWRWVRSAGGAGVDRANKVAIDAQGNTYVAGGFSGTARFGNLTLASAGAMDGFVAKYDTAGNLLWANRFGSPADDEALGLAVGPDGTVYMSGFFNGTINVGGNALTSRGIQDIIVAALSPAGQWAWVRSAGSPGEDQGLALTVWNDALFMGGFIRGNATFGTQTGTAIGERDAFLARYALDGTAIWVRVVGSTTRDAGLGITAFGLGPQNGVVLCGSVSGPVTINNVTYPAAGGTDAFTAAYLFGGSFVGFRRFGGPGNDAANAVAIGTDPAQGEGFLRTYAVGTFQNTMNIPQGPELTSAGLSDAFLVGFDLSGNTAVARRWGSTNNDFASDIALASDKIWVTGGVQGRQTAALSTAPRAFGSTDIFVSRHSFNGTMLQFLQAGGQGTEAGRTVAAGPGGSASVGGFFRQSSRFGPFELGEFGQGDACVGRIGNAPLLNFREGDEAFFRPAAASARLLPNPAAAGSQVTLEVVAFAAESREAALSVLDMAGRVVSRHPVQLDGLQVSTPFAAPAQPGVYIIRLEAAGQPAVTQRLTVQ